MWVGTLLEEYPRPCKAIKLQDKHRPGQWWPSRWEPGLLGWVQWPGQGVLCLTIQLPKELGVRRPEWHRKPLASNSRQAGNLTILGSSF